MTVHHKLLEAKELVSHEDLPVVPVYYADTRLEVRRYCAMLEQADIPAWAGDDVTWSVPSPEDDLGNYVLVPESFQNQAAELIASRCAATDIGGDEVDDDLVDDDEDLFADPDDPAVDDDDLDDDWAD